MKKRAKMSRAQIKQKLKGLVLKEEDIASWDKDESEYKHIVWIEKVASMANELGDTDRTLIDSIIKHIPQPLRMSLANNYSSWEDLKNSVRAVPIELLQDAKDRLEGNKSRDQTITSLQQQIAQLSIQVQTGQGRGTRTATASVTTPPQYLPMPTIQTSAKPIVTSGWQGQSVMPPYFSFTRARILERAAMVTQRPNTEVGKRQYEQDVEAWHSTHSSAPPSLERPYPLKPGTMPLGSGECFACGMVMEPPPLCRCMHSLRGPATS